MLCRNEKLKDLLEDFKHDAGLIAHWVFVGSAGRTTRPSSGGVLHHYPEYVSLKC